MITSFIYMCMIVVLSKFDEASEWTYFFMTSLTVPVQTILLPSVSALVASVCAFD